VQHTLATGRAATLIKLAFAAGAKLSAAFATKKISPSQIWIAIYLERSLDIIEINSGDKTQLTNKQCRLRDKIYKLRKKALTNECSNSMNIIFLELFRLSNVCKAVNNMLINIPLELIQLRSDLKINTGFSEGNIGECIDSLLVRQDRVIFEY
jgi:hypothetical protein